ncbi:LLM class flavin-dependent oxidoreductase [Aquihabitans daechungensis]|uniref:LLM class flavin-dependent oxidoreductase n=1 Tax=Aquihabitans daechungensis TaxID=1052257 RepID=UPI003B9DE822
MRFSFWISTQHTWDETLDLASHAEATGWEGLWVADHFMPNDDTALDQPMHEALALLAALAVAVPRVRIGSLVLGNTYRHPAVVAKAAATIDQISGGRLVLGIGAGWQENEHARYGIPLGTVPERLDWFEEACEAIVSLRDHPRSTVTGQRYQLDDAPLEPKATGRLPLLIGASGQKRMAAIVARYADEWNTWSTPELWLEKRVGFDQALDEAGRARDDLYRSTQALVFLGADGHKTAEDFAKVRPAIGGTSQQLVDTIGNWADAGLDELIVPSFTLGSGARAKEAIDQIITEVAPAFR